MKILPVLATFCLVGCTTPNVGTPSKNSPSLEIQQFHCQNGLTVTRQNLSPNEIKLLVAGGHTGVLQSSKIGSGERFSGMSGLFGFGGDWRQKGDIATFSYTMHGKQTRVICHQLL